MNLMAQLSVMPGNATEALEQVWKKKWDLVLLDITMHGRTRSGCLEGNPEFRVQIACTYS